MLARKQHSQPLLSALSIAASLVAIGVTTTTPSDASVAIALTVDDLARDASAFVRVTPLDATTAWEDGRIVTQTRVRIDDVVTGSLDGAREVRVRTLGGVVGDVGQVVEGEARFSPGVPAFLFVRRVPATSGSSANKTADIVFVVGRAQGELVVVRDVAGRETVRLGNLGALVARKLRAPERASTGKPVALLEGLDAAAVRTEVVRAWEVSHAR